MSQLRLAEADEIADAVLAAATRRELKPVAVCVLDEGGHVLVIKRQDGATFLRVDVATAKAWTAVSLAGPSRGFAEMAEARPQFVTSVVSVSRGRMVPAAGGVLVVRDGNIVGAVGVSGDTPDNDEAVAADSVESLAL